MTPQDFKEVKERLALELDALRTMVIPGLKLEFGVAMGGSLGRIARTWPDDTVWGFDSFKGIREPWQKGDVLKPAGYMSVHGKLPRRMPDNVKLVVGYFEDTLAAWWEEHRGPISFLHIDCDVYSAAKLVLNTLDDGIVTGTVIRFDDLCVWEAGKRMYHNWSDGEWRALHEWIEESSRIVEPLWHNRKEAGTIRVLAPPLCPA